MKLKYMGIQILLMLLVYKYIFAQGVFAAVLAVAIHYFNRFLTEFFENRPIPQFWIFFFLGLSSYLVLDSLLFIPFLSGQMPTKEYTMFYAILQPLGPVAAAYGIYKVEEETRNV